MAIKRKETVKAWAIDTRSKEGHGLIGKLWPFKVHYYPFLPWHLDGYQVSMWRTRKEALADLPDTRCSFPRAKVVRATLTIEWEKK